MFHNLKLWKFLSTQLASDVYFDQCSRDSGNDFGRFSVSFIEGRILNIWAACNYPTRNANFKSWISDIRLKWKSFSWVFKRGLNLFFQINICKDLYFVTKLFPEFIQLISLPMYYDVLIHTCIKQVQSYHDKSFISEKTIWFDL